MVITSVIPSRSAPFYIPLNRISGFDYQIGYKYKIEVLVTYLANPLRILPIAPLRLSHEEKYFNVFL